MKHTLLLLSLCALCAGCMKDYGTPTTESYPVNGDYTALEASYAFQVTVSDQVSEVQVTVGELAQDLVKVYVKDNTLHIGFKWGTLYNGTATAVIPANARLSELDLSGASSFTGDLSAAYVGIELSGVSHYNGNIDADKLDFEISGASTATVSGRCESTMDVELSGASTLNASLLEAAVVEGELSGASMADVCCSQRLEVELSGASTLIYAIVPGSSPIVNCHTSGGSQVRMR